MSDRTHLLDWISPAVLRSLDAARRVNEQLAAADAREGKLVHYSQLFETLELPTVSDSDGLELLRGR